MNSRLLMVILLVPLALLAQIPEKKQTELKLYITAQSAWERWQINRDKIKIIDVRTPEEYVFVGHAPMAINIPFMFLH